MIHSGGAWCWTMQTALHYMYKCVRMRHLYSFLLRIYAIRSGGRWYWMKLTSCMYIIYMIYIIRI